MNIGIRILSLLLLLLLLLHCLGKAWANSLMGPLSSALVILLSLREVLSPQKSQSRKLRAAYLCILLLALFSLCISLSQLLI